MTIAASEHEIVNYDLPKTNWFADLWNQLVYDCCCWEYGHKTDDQKVSCETRSAPLREDMMPTVKAILMKMYEKTLYHYLEQNGNLMMETLCRDMDHGYWTGAILTNYDEETQTQKVDLLINHLADNFRLKSEVIYGWEWESVLHFFGETESEIKSELLQYQDCIQSYNNFTKQAKAASILVKKYGKEAKTIFSLPRFVLQTSERYLDKIAIGALKEKVKNSLDMLNLNSNITADVVLMVLLDDGWWCKPDCPDIPIDHTISYSSILKIMKFALKPYDYKVRETSDRNDLLEAGRAIFDPEYSLKDPQDFTHYDPSVIFCLFGHDKVPESSHEGLTMYCDDILRTFSNLGMGYTLNAANFYEIYKVTPQTDTFCNEIVHSKDKSCKINTQTVSNKIEVNGPRYALRLMLHVPKALTRKNSWNLQSLSIHHSKSVPFMSGNIIKPSPGLHTKIVVTPRVTITDDALAKSDIDKKNCFSSKYDDNPLKLFSHYSQDNCIFECHLIHIRKQYGCIPWDFPMLSDSDPICSSYKRKAILADLQSTNSSSWDCSHCLDDCDKIDYEFTINTTPFQDICQLHFYQRAILEAANINGLDKYLEADENFDAKLHFLQDPCTAYAQEGIAMVDIYVGPPKAVHITRSPRVTFLQQLANLGLSNMQIFQLTVELCTISVVKHFCVY